MASSPNSLAPALARARRRNLPGQNLLRALFMMVAFVPAVTLTASQAQTIRVDITPEHSTHQFIPNQALGAGIDRMPAQAIDKLFTEPALNRVLSAGWQTVTYRQNTELHIEAWHWNPKGTWSDPSGKGYFTGSDTPTEDRKSVV